MNTLTASPLRTPVRHRQWGAASVAIAILIMFILAAAVTAALNMSGTAVFDAAKNDEQVVALYLAESGVQKAQSVIATKATAGTLVASDCTGISGGPFNMGAGNFSYPSPAVETPTGCGGATPCTSCKVTVTGNIVKSSVVTASRTVVANMTTTPTEGVEGCGTAMTLPMTVTTPGRALVFSNVAYRAKNASSGCSASDTASTRVLSCVNTPGATCDITGSGDFWNQENTGANNISSMGVASNIMPNGLPAGLYTITTTLAKVGGGTPVLVSRDYAQSAVLLYPPTSSSPAVALMGTYSSNTTNQTNSLTGTVKKEWTCQKQSGAANGSDLMFRAAVSDTLLYGFSAYKIDPAQGSLSVVTLGSQPLRQIASIDGTQVDPVYSQIWMTYNPAYYPSTESPQTVETTKVTGATNGAQFTGSIGATGVSGTITASGATFTLDADLPAGGLLFNGDRVYNGATLLGTIGACTNCPATSVPTRNWGTSGSKYTFSGTANGSGTTYTIRSTRLRVSASPTPTGGVLKTNDSITDAITPPTSVYGTLSSGVSAALSCTGTALTNGPGPAANCVASDQTYTLNSVSTATLAPQSSLYAAGGPNTITVPTSLTTPAVGTALAVSSGTGAFSSTVFTGDITGTALTNTGGVTLCAGDALFSGGLKQALPSTLTSGIKSNTTVFSPDGCTAGPFVLSRAVDVPILGGSMVARAAVTGTITPSATSFTVSRPPSPALLSSNAVVVCGGICALLTTGGVLSADIPLALSGFITGTDWSSGFACLNGVNPDNIVTLGKKVATRGSWSEMVQ
jgi:hypothetical protein